MCCITGFFSRNDLNRDIFVCMEHVLPLLEKSEENVVYMNVHVLMKCGVQWNIYRLTLDIHPVVTCPGNDSKGDRDGDGVIRTFNVT